MVERIVEWWMVDWTAMDWNGTMDWNGVIDSVVELYMVMD